MPVKYDLPLNNTLVFYKIPVPKGDRIPYKPDDKPPPNQDWSLTQLYANIKNPSHENQLKPSTADDSILEYT
jgi:hypothetical protein